MSKATLPSGDGTAPNLTTAPLEKTPHKIFAALAAMMFLQLFVWGAWYVSITSWLKVSGYDDLTSWVYTVCPLAAILSPLFLGMVADRFFAPHKVFGVMHLIGAAVMASLPLLLPYFSGVEHSFWHPLVLLLLGHALCYMPTLALANTVAFQHVRRLETEFPIIRVFGTFGWIAAGLVVSMPVFGGESSVNQFWIVAAAAALLGVFGFFLPKTVPPLAGKKTTVRQALGLDALALLKDRNFAVFMLCSLLICIPLAGYFSDARNFVEFTAFADATRTMTLGQVSEVFFMLAMPLFFARLGIKKMLMISMATWFVRYGLFATAADAKTQWMVLGGLLMHGICYDFFFVAGFIYVDRAAQKVRAQAQAFFVIITQGVGMVIGMHLIGALKGVFTTTTEAKSDGSPVAIVTKTVAWDNVWLTLAVLALVITVIFGLFFREKKAAAAAG